ncbi:hypothetical protein [Burkholderia sp. Ac-20365]|jgi:hypothetical protein|uniref:hypothetical protein n=1 Tax=Burkholderia sp. Ac-20365 TaxID=2703897 RepID=UPI00197BEE43|nr:hypothetical protein [Burkholderia sp. Ac-20365]MBN3760736.1 hypothetical protein [Burkholderia sp. Ac-20365]
MTERRELADMLVDVADGALASASATGIRATSVEVSLPVEVALQMRAGALAVIAELPRFVFRSSFDAPPGRLKVIWSEGGTS